MKDAVSCCQLAGVEPPQSAFNLGDVTLASVSPMPPEPQDNIVSPLVVFFFMKLNSWGYKF